MSRQFGHFRTRRARTGLEIPKREVIEIKTYEYLPRIATSPVMVIQSTHDHYLPADAARILFGPDTELRKLQPVTARNHRFSGGREELYRDMEEALSWIMSLDHSQLTGSSR